MKGCRFWLALVPVVLLGSPAAADQPNEAGLEFFEKKIRPILVQNCYSCHSARERKDRGGLELDSQAGFLRGGDNGPIVVPGKPEKSRLVLAVSYKDVDLRMPPRSKLPDAAIADLTAWVRMGAPYPKDDTNANREKKFDLEKRRKEHWAWKPVGQYDPPRVRDSAGARTPIDRFILARLEEKGLSLAKPADRRTLLRRVYFDLIGLPPSPEEIEAFIKDSRPDAFARVVDRLLASPRFGERWARHWLDLVRYAESRGHEFDYTAPNAWQYRDYVIRALNADVSYDQFVHEHIAGDLLPRPRTHPTEGFNESILGTGFWFLDEQVHSPVDIRQDQADRFDNRLDVLTKTFLGLTVSCARCHDHKFDAISTRDYHALLGFLESSSYRLARFDSMLINRGIAEELSALREKARPELQKALAGCLRPALEKLPDYLLAARETLDAGARVDLAAIASRHKLAVPLLRRWVSALEKAGRDERDLLHPWVKQDSLATLAQRWQQKREQVSAARRGVQVIVDYSRFEARDWLPDGEAFGTGPLRPGEFRPRPARARGLVELIEIGAAEVDPTWDRLTLARGTENDPGALGGDFRAGRMLRTPTFPLTTGRVHALVRGSGKVYAAVGQHAMIAGPLHGALVRSFSTGGRWQWLTLELKPYIGLRTHLEFSAATGAELAIHLVVQGETPPDLDGLPNALLAALIAEESARNPEKLAAGYRKLFEQALDRLASGRLPGSPEAGDTSRLVNWLLRHPHLFREDETWQDRTLDAAQAGHQAQLSRLVAGIRTESRLALAMLDGSGQDEHVFIRGNPRTLGEIVPRRFLEALTGKEGLKPARGSGRLELARQMTDPRVNPFIARVMVNRLWHHLFGRGIVASVDNFGVLGESPTHPELLDYLAAKFVAGGWSIKRLIRELVLSDTYGQASIGDPMAEQVDPSNVLLHRANVRRLQGEAIRDALLALSGRLDGRMFGPPVPVHLTPFQEGRGRPASGPLDGNGRRSLYLAVRRNFLSSFLLAFDTPIPFSTVGRRSLSNVPAQALILLNDPFVHQQSALWGKRVQSESGPARQRIERMYLSALGRPVTATELEECLAFLESQAQAAGLKPDDPAVWADLAHVLCNLKEFIFLR